MVITLENITPPKRGDNIPYDRARIERALSDEGPWSTVEVLNLAAFGGLDANPAAPMARLLTSELAPPGDAWFRVIFLDNTNDESDPSTPKFSGDQLPSTATLTYATVGDLRKYASELKSRSTTDLEDALLKAERDIDDYAGFIAPDEATGLKFIPADMDASSRNKLRDATCAQARYRLFMGPVFFIEQVQYREVSGDISSSKADYIGPETKREFPQGFRVLTGRFS